MLLSLFGVSPGIAQESEQHLPLLVCYADELHDKSLSSLDGLRGAIQVALSRQDEAAMGFFGERLAELIGNDSTSALQVIGWARTAKEPELSLYLGALRDTGAVREPRVVAQLVEMAETHADAGHQLQALAALGTQRHFEPAMLERLATLARQDTRSPEVAMQAMSTLGQVMSNDFKRTGRIEPYFERLVDVALESSNAGVRSQALAMSTFAGARFDSGALDKLAGLQTDPSPRVREMAAQAMASGRDTQRVLEHFRKSFGAENDLCVRWAIFLNAVRAGGVRALPLLQDLAQQDPRFLEDYTEFKALYEEGYTDFDRMFPIKPIHHQCGVAGGRAP